MGVVRRSALVAVCAVLALAAGGSAGRTQAAAPELLEPRAGQAFTATERGVEVTFRIRYVPTSQSEVVRLRASLSPKVGYGDPSCPYLAQDVLAGQFARTADPSVWEVRLTVGPRYTGTVYWQAVPSLCESPRSAVGSFRIVAPTRPLSAARLDGAFKMTMVVTSATGFKDTRKGDRSEVNWTFKPLCAAGPCAVEVESWSRIGSLFRRIHWSGLRLNRAGAAYAGHGRQSLYKCVIVSTPGETTVRVRVTAARWVEGWVATRIVGTYEHKVPAARFAFNQCPASSFRATISGVPLGWAP